MIKKTNSKNTLLTFYVVLSIVRFIQCLQHDKILLKNRIRRKNPISNANLFYLNQVEDQRKHFYTSKHIPFFKQTYILASKNKSINAEKTNDKKINKRERVVIIGAGWAGYSAASALASATSQTSGDEYVNKNLDIILLDAAPRGKGGLAGGWRTASGRPVEAGIHGFWREYQNTFQVIKGIEGVEIDDVLTPYTPSVLISQSGKVAVAPVLGSGEKNQSKDSNNDIDSVNPVNGVLNNVAKLLPPPLDLALLTIPSPSSELTNFDRISALNLLPMWADFQQENPTSWQQYDSISAEDLFLEKAGISKKLYQELVSPLLHVLPMAPGYDCSAAAALSCFHVFALQSNGAFDVRWCRGSVVEKIFNPWNQQLIKEGVEIRGGSKVLSIVRLDEEAQTHNFQIQVESKNNENGDNELIQCDSVILAVGATSIGKIAANSPTVFENIPIAKNFSKLRGITCVAVRLFLRTSSVTRNLYGGQHDATQLQENYANAMKDSPILVCGENIGKGKFQELKETGFCVYDLQRLQDEFSVDYDISTSDFKGKCAVLEIDFFRANAIANLDNDAVIDLTIKVLSHALNLPPLSQDLILDSSVLRARDAVSHFSIGSASYSPPTTLSENLYICGDWVDRTGHASWSTEKAVVTGRQAAKSILDKSFDKLSNKIQILNAADDTQSLKALREIAVSLRKTFPPKDDGVPLSPLVFMRDFFA